MGPGRLRRNASSCVVCNSHENIVVCPASPHRGRGALTISLHLVVSRYALSVVFLSNTTYVVPEPLQDGQGLRQDDNDMPTAGRCVWDVFTSQVRHGLRARGVRGAVRVAEAMLPTGGEGSEGWPMTANGKRISFIAALLSIVNSDVH